MSKLKITRGSTFADTLRWATSECRMIAAVLDPTAPVTLEAVSHGLPDGWFVSIEGHPRIPETSQFSVKVIDDDTLELSCLNGTPFGTARNVVIRALTPVDLSGYTARMHIRDKVGGTMLLELTTENDRIEIDNALKTISRTISADDTADIAWKKGVFDLEMVSGDYVIKIDSGTVEVVGEVTV
jgi:hypothetical protein